MRSIYVDYAATTPVDPRVLEAMKPYFTEAYGNPSSLNVRGSEAKEALEESRETISRFMNADADEIIFTGSATEANNLVLKGHAFQRGRQRCHIAVSTVDHDSVLNSARWLEQVGYRVTYLPVDQTGLVKLNTLEKTLKEGVTLTSVVHGNNEIGTIQPIAEIAKICRDHDTLFHTDAVQSFGKMPIDVKKMELDFMTVNAHKLYGPKGVGALYMRSGLKLQPLIHGGGHESGLRSGTENVPAIVGFAKAVDLRRGEMQSETEQLTGLRDKLIAGSLEIEEAYLIGHPTRRLANNINLRFSSIEGESIVLGLDSEGIAASSGSACSSMSGEASHVLLAIGLTPEEARGSIRFSLGKHNTEEDVAYILEVLPKVVKRLRVMSPLVDCREKRKGVDGGG